SVSPRSAAEPIAEPLPDNNKRFFPRGRSCGTAGPVPAAGNGVWPTGRAVPGCALGLHVADYPISQVGALAASTAPGRLVAAPRLDPQAGTSRRAPSLATHDQLLHHHRLVQPAANAHRLLSQGGTAGVRVDWLDAAR